MNRFGRIAERLVAKLLEDYGITKNLYKKIKKHIDDIYEALKADDIDKLRALETKLGGKEVKGFLAELSSRLPEDVAKALIGMKYRVRFVDMARGYWHDAGYIPGKNEISIKYNVYLPAVVAGTGERDKLLKDIARTRMTMRHEVTHAIRDAMTGHIKEFIDRARKDKGVWRVYEEKGHQEIEFEIDAVVNQIDELFKGMSKREREAIGFGDLVKIFPGLRLPARGSSAFRVWVKRLHREGLLTGAMRNELQGRKGAVAGHEGIVGELLSMARGLVAVDGETFVSGEAVLIGPTVDGYYEKAIVEEARPTEYRVWRSNKSEFWPLTVQGKMGSKWVKMFDVEGNEWDWLEEYFKSLGIKARDVAVEDKANRELRTLADAL